MRETKREQRVRFASWLKGAALSCVASACVVVAVVAANVLPTQASTPIEAPNASNAPVVQQDSVSLNGQDMAIPDNSESTPTDAHPDEGTKYESGVVLVQLEDGVTPDELNASLAGASCVQNVSVTESDIVLGYVELPLAEGFSVNDAMRQLQTIPVIQDAQPNYIYHLDTDDQGTLTAGGIDFNNLIEQAKAVINDKYQKQQWALDSVEAYDAWDSVKSNKGVTVAVIDTGCLTSHEDLRDNVVYSYDAVTQRADIIYDSNGHGTHVCGIIAAVANNELGVAGVSYNAQILPINVFSGGNAGTTELVRAYNFIIQNASYYNIRVANMSLGADAASIEQMNSYDKDKALYNAVLKARNEKGVLTVCSAGNHATTNGPYLNYPSDYLDIATSVISLQAGIDGAPPTRASSSNYNMPEQMTKDISAPGDSIISTHLNNKYAYLSGTSMASPCVAGIAALIFKANPDLTPVQVQGILYGSAVDLGDDDWDMEYGYGEVNAKNAIANMGLFLDGESSMLVGGSCTLSPSAEGSWTWSSSDPAKATVDSSGVVTGMAAGQYAITAKLSEDEKVSRTVTVYDVSISSETQMRVGESIDLTFHENPDTGMWFIESSNEGIVTLAKNTETGGFTVTGVSRGTVTISATLASNPNLVVSQQIDVLPATNDFSAATVRMNGWTYDGVAHEPEVSVELDGHTFNSDEYTVSYSGNKDAGTCTATVSLIDTSYYVNTATGTCTVEKRPVTLTSGSASKVYDGSALTATSVTVGGSGFVSGEVSDVRATGTITNVGSAVNSITYTPGPSFKADNYAITESKGTLSVSKRPATITANSKSKVYDGTALTASATGYATSGFVKAGDVASVTLAGSVTNVGSATATVSDYKLANGMDGNYSVTTASGTLTVSKRPATITANSKSKAYDGTALTATSAGYTLSGFVNSSDVVSVTLGGSVTNVGSVKSSVTGHALASGMDKNYSVTTKDGTLTVTAAPLTGATVLFAQSSFTYDGAAKKPDVTVVCGSAKLTKDVDFTVVYPEDCASAGTKTCTVTGKGNYTGTASGSFSIAKKLASITAKSGTKVYDGTALTASAAGYALDGFVKADDVASVTLAGSVTNVGSATATVSDYKLADGMDGNYTVTTASGTLAVTPASLSGATVTFPEGPIMYDGKAQKPAATVSLGGKQLTEDTDYTIAYSSNVNAGTATVTVTGTGNFEDAASGTFPIAKRPVTLTSGSASKVYDGSALTAPEVTVGGSGFVSGEVSGVRATGAITNVGSAVNSIAYTPGPSFKAGNYTITESKGTLSVSKRPATITANSKSKVYDGTALAASATGYATSGFVKAGDVASVTLAGSVTNVGSATATVSGYKLAAGMDGNYAVTTANGALAVTPAPISRCTVTTSTSSETYTGSALTPAVTVKDGLKSLRSGIDYTVAYSDNVKVGTATATVTGKGNYSGSKGTTFNINQASIALATVTLSPASYTYDGTAKQPAVTVKLGGKTLAQGTDYTVAYSNNTKVGIGTATVTGKGNYTGTAKGTFTIAVARVTVWRLYDTRTGEHHYTSDANERKVLLSRGNWKDEGTAWVTPSTSSTPVYRVYDLWTGEHHYTSDANEKKALVGSGRWRDEGIAWYSDDAKTCKVYRVERHDKGPLQHHHYTINANERNVCIKQWGWNDEGIGWYALSAS